jgi:hypothetical protein
MQQQHDRALTCCKPKSAIVQSNISGLQSAKLNASGSSEAALPSAKQSFPPTPAQPQSDTRSLPPVHKTPLEYDAVTSPEINEQSLHLNVELALSLASSIPHWNFHIERWLSRLNTSQTQ